MLNEQRVAITNIGFNPPTSLGCVLVWLVDISLKIDNGGLFNPISCGMIWVITI
jgi:hypothetical protein